MSSARRFAATSLGSSPASVASRSSEKPMALSMRNWAALGGRPCSRTRASISTMSLIWRMNHGSILHASKICSSSKPSLIACATLRMRSGEGVPSAARTTFLSSPSPRPGSAMSLRPVKPVSIERSAFCSDSGKVRPMAMASPTDFIEVVSTGLAPGNFSKAKRGILVTT